MKRHLKPHFAEVGNPEITKSLICPAKMIK